MANKRVDTPARNLAVELAEALITGVTQNTTRQALADEAFAKDGKIKVRPDPEHKGKFLQYLNCKFADRENSKGEKVKALIGNSVILSCKKVLVARGDLDETDTNFMDGAAITQATKELNIQLSRASKARGMSDKLAIKGTINNGFSVQVMERERSEDPDYARDLASLTGRYIKNHSLSVDQAIRTMEDHCADLVGQAEAAKLAEHLEQEDTEEEEVPMAQAA